MSTKSAIKKTTKLSLTSPRKMPKAVKPPVARKATTHLKEVLQAAVEQSAAQVPAGARRDGNASLPAAQIGQLAKVAKGKAKPKAAKPQKPGAKVDQSATLFALLYRAQRVTPREMMDATGLTHGALKAAVGKLLRQKGLKLVLQRNPQPDPKDRKLTSYLYGVEPRA